MGVSARADDTTVRIDKRTSLTLDRLAKEMGQAKKDIVAKAVERLRRERVLEAFNAGAAALKSDPTAWREEREERRAWESTLTDGLTDE